MKTLADRDSSCTISQASWPVLFGAALRGVRSFASHSAVMDHLDACPACAAEFTEILTLMLWREAQDPFNAGSLPLASRRLPELDLGGASCDRVTS